MGVSYIDIERRIIQIAGVGYDVCALTDTGEIWWYKFDNDSIGRQWVKIEDLPASDRPIYTSMKSTFEDIMK